jgi:hypothetical protein
VSRTLVTFAIDGYRQLSDLSRPGQIAYARRHGYEPCTRPPRLRLRPPSWLKVTALLDALDLHEEALWLDADVVVVDGELDLADEVPADAWQALVRHHTPDGEVANGGVWLVRRPMRGPLEQLWQLTRYLNHPWWEQAGLLDLLGYRHDPRPVELAAPTDLYTRTHWLGLEWNSHEQNDRHPAPRFAHATAGDLDWRASVMRRHIARAAELAQRKGALSHA